MKDAQLERYGPSGGLVLHSRKSFTDEDFSELAQALEWACEFVVTEGYTVSSWNAARHGIPRALVGAFNQGFDGSRRFPGFNKKAYNLGVQFRDRWMSPLFEIQNVRPH